MSIGSAFTKAWQSLKNFVTKTNALIVKDAPIIQNAVKVGSAAIVAAVPSAAPAVSAFDSIEETVMGDIAGAFHAGSVAIDAGTGQATVTLSAELSAYFQDLVNRLSGHPDVVAATVAPAAKTA